MLSLLFSSLLLFLHPILDEYLNSRNESKEYVFCGATNFNGDMTDWDVLASQSDISALKCVALKKIQARSFTFDASNEFKCQSTEAAYSKIPFMSSQHFISFFPSNKLYPTSNYLC